MSLSSDGDPSDGATSLLTPRPREFGFERFQLEVTAGPDTGTSVTSTGTEFGIGTAPGNQLVLTDRTVSRHHCVITAVPRGYLLRDLGSTNGTWLVGYRIDGAYLKPGATLKVGISTLRFDTLRERVVEPLSEKDGFDRLLGKSPAMRRVFAALPRIAASESTVLLLGETGTGKSLLAETIHNASPRRNGRFTVVDCSSIPPTLIESELLGHERGAFTGAHASRAGVFESTQGGTVFLDEIGELPLDMQPKLLRLLEERVIRRVGGQEPIRLDVRILAATNRDLRRSVNDGSFRSDVFYRLNAVMITIPPLRSRLEDIPFLAKHFYEQIAAPGDAELPASFVEALVRRDWPGNVRELRGAVERAVLLGGLEGAPDSVRVSLSGFPPPSGAPPDATRRAADPTPEVPVPFRVAKERAVARWERRFIRDLLRKHGGNLSRAARAARMDRNHLREVIRRHDFTVEDD